MLLQKFKELTKKAEVQHLPYGDVELFDEENLPVNFLVDVSKNVSQVTIEKEDELILISKIAPKVFLQLKGKKSYYNIGIMKNVMSKMYNELRSNAIFSSK